MSYIANNPASYSGKPVGNGQCVVFVQTAAGAPLTSAWKEGVMVKGSAVVAGTAIATFQGGKYTNDTTGNSHAAIYVSQDNIGITVWDQWAGNKPRPVHQRVIAFRGGQGEPRNDGDAYSVIE